MDASHGYVRALALGCFYRASDHVAGQLRGDKECPFSGVTTFGRVWRNVPEIDARSLTLSSNLRKKGLNMKRSAFRGRSGHITFSEGFFLCSFFLVSAKVPYAYFVL